MHFSERYFRAPFGIAQMAGAPIVNRAVVRHPANIRTAGERTGRARRKPKPRMAVVSAPAVKGFEEVAGCLQLLDLRFERTSHCVNSEEAGNSRTHQMQ